MKLECWVYVTTQELGGRQTTRAHLSDLRARLIELAAARPGMACMSVALFEPEDFEIEDVDREIVESVTRGTLPAIYLNITYDLDRTGPGDPAVQALLGEYGFRFAVTDRRDD